MALRVIYTPPEPAAPANQSRSSLDNFSTGVVKGALSTVRGLGTIGQSVIDKTVGQVLPQKSKSLSDVYRPSSLVGQKITDFLAPKNTAESVGFGTEQAAEYLVPAFKAAKAERYVDILSKGISNPVAAAASRLLVKGGIQGLASSAVKFAQTGGDAKEAIKTGAIAGGSRAALGAIGEVARGLKLPERLYQTIFKNAKTDMMQELNTEGIANLQRTKPEVFKNLVDSGVIKIRTGLDGAEKAFINETTAEKALNRGLRGSFKTMANEVVGKKYESEYALQQALSKYGGTVDLPEPQFKKVLDKIAIEYEDVGFNELSNEAKLLSRGITEANGKLPPDMALDLRRFLDKLRFARSYDAPAANLSTAQSNLKTLSDALRGRINKIPGVGKIMEDYSFYIDALDDLSKEAARRGNSQVVSLIDSLFLGGSISGANPVGFATAGIARKFLLSGPGATGAAQAIKNSVSTPLGSAVRNAASSAVSPGLGGQQQ